jgi:hypothetical protein
VDFFSGEWENKNCAKHFANKEAGKRAVIVSIVAESRRASRQSQLYAILQSLSIIGLPRRPIDGRVTEKRRGRAPLEVEWTSLVVTRRPEHLI